MESSIKDLKRNKNTAMEKKRVENNKRTRNARLASVNDRRKINSVLKNDSIHCSVSPVLEKPLKPPRSVLLEIWRENKAKEKMKQKKVKPNFVVKHLEYKDQGVFVGAGVSKSDKKGINISHRQGHEKKPSQLRWKNVQGGKDSNQLRPMTRSLRKQNNQTFGVEKTANIYGKASTIKQSNTSQIKKSKCIRNENVFDVKNNKKEEIRDALSVAESSPNKENNLVDGSFSFQAPKGISLVSSGFEMENRNRLFNATEKSFVSEQSLSNKEYEQIECIENEKGIANEEHCNDDDDPMSPLLNSSQNNNDITVSLSMQSANKTPILFSKKQDSEKLNLKTPVSLFKNREDICNSSNQPPTTPKNTTPLSNRKLSLTPKNFLSKIDDPVARKLASPGIAINEEMKLQKTPPDVAASVKLFSGKVTAEETLFANSIKEWEHILQNTETPEFVHGDILSAIGQAQLLMKKRFKQFKELIELHKDKSAEKAAHASDLDGFWEVIYMQVEDVHRRFKELNILRDNNWKVTENKIISKKIKRPTQPKVTKFPKEAKANAKRNDFKKFRQQMLQKKKEMETQVMEPNRAFISVLTPSKTKEGTNKMTPLRRSLRHLDIKDKNSPNIGFMINVNEKTNGDGIVPNSQEEDKVELLNSSFQQQLVMSPIPKIQGNEEDENFVEKFLSKPASTDMGEKKTAKDLMFFSP